MQRMPHPYQRQHYPEVEPIHLANYTIIHLPADMDASFRSLKKKLNLKNHKTFYDKKETE